MEVKHTPLPWMAENGESRGAWIMGADEGWSALVCGDNDSTAIANKDFIVRACNSHYELLEALRELVGACTRYDEQDEHSALLAANYCAAKDKAIAAIAKAEGRS